MSRSHRLPARVLSALLLALGLLAPGPAAHSATTTTVSLRGPATIVAGDTAGLRGAVDSRRPVDVALQSRTSRRARWRTVDWRPDETGRFSFAQTPARTTWYRIKAGRGRGASTSRTVRVVVDDPVYRWFDLFQLGTAAGDADGFMMDGSIYAGDWHDDYGYDGFVGEVDAADPVDSATFDLSTSCDRLTGALGTSGYEGSARVQLATDGTGLLDRTMGDGQWQRLDLDVAGLESLRIDLTHLGGNGLESFLLGWRVRCDSRLTDRLEPNRKHQWLALYDRGTLDGDPDGFAAEGSIFSGEWHDRYGYEGFVVEVSSTDVEDWTTFAVPRGCTRFDAAVGTIYQGAAAVRILSQDGDVLYRRQLGQNQWQRLDLDLTGVTRLRITATMLTGGTPEVVVLGPEVYCSRT